MNSECRELLYRDINLHDRASFTAIVGESVVKEFADISGDYNPLHMNEEYAQGTELHGRVAHGMIIGALFSRLIGMHLPGQYSLYLSQTLHFHSPMAIGAEVIIEGEVVHKTDAYRTVEIHTSAIDTTTKALLVSGEAMVTMLR